MKTLNENLFENLSVTELEERLEMAGLTVMAADSGGDHSCSSIDCLQHDISRAEADMLREMGYAI